MNHHAGAAWTTIARHARSSTFHRILLTLLTWDARWRERRHLAELTEEALADVGRSRAEMETEIGKPFWKP